jgi:flagellin
MSGGLVHRLEGMSRRLAMTDRAASGSIQRLASGNRIVSAADDAAGLAIAERLRSQSAGALRAQRNVQDGIGAIQTADGALGEVTMILQRTRELAVQYQSGTLTATDRAAAQREADALEAEVARIATQTRFNGNQLLAGGRLAVHAGGFDADGIEAMLPDLADLVAGEVFSLDGSGAAQGGGGNGGGNGNGNGNGNGGNGHGNGNGNANGHGGGNGGGNGGAAPPIARVAAALNAVSAQRALLGAFQNRLEHVLATLAVTHEQLVASESRIRDADVGAEVVSLTRHRMFADVNRALAAQGHVRARNALHLLAA